MPIFGEGYDSVHVELLGGQTDMLATRLLSGVNFLSAYSYRSCHRAASLGALLGLLGGCHVFLEHEVIHD